MLVVTRKHQESVVVGSPVGGKRLVTVTVLEIRGAKVKLGLDVAPETPVHRQEVWDRIQAEGGQERPMTVPNIPVPR